LIETKLKFIADNICNIYRPDPKWIKEKNWLCRIYLMGYDRIESNFIANTIYKINKYATEFIVHDKIEIIEKQQISVDYVHNFYSLDRNLDIAINCAGFTDNDIEYLYFKDSENEIFMLFGSQSFISKIMPISLKEYELYYNEFYGSWGSAKIDQLLQRIWEDYPR